VKLNQHLLKDQQRGCFQSYAIIFFSIVQLLSTQQLTNLETDKFLGLENVILDRFRFHEDATTKLVLAVIFFSVITFVTLALLLSLLKSAGKTTIWNITKNILTKIKFCKFVCFYYNWLVVVPFTQSLALLGLNIMKNPMITAGIEIFALTLLVLLFSMMILLSIYIEFCFQTTEYISKDTLAQ
jgi:hypothetical protein